MAIDVVQVRLVDISEKRICNHFYNSIYRKRRTLRQWEWEFEQNTFQKSPIPFAAAFDKGRIVGTQALIPIRMIDKNGTFWAAKSEETLVDPNYRGQRIFERMYELLFEYARENNFSSIWGFTPATKAFERLNFAIAGKTKQLFMPFSQKALPILLRKAEGIERNLLKSTIVKAANLLAQPLSSIRVAFGARTLKGVEVRTITESSDQFGELSERFVKQHGGVTIHRDGSYVHWRIFNNPYIRSIVKGVFFENEMLGWAAYALGDDGMGYLVDIIVPGDDDHFESDELVRILLLEAVIGARNMGALAIRGWHVNNHPFDRILARAAREIGFYKINRGHAFVLHSLSSERGETISESFDNWYITRIFTEGVFG